MAPATATTKTDVYALTAELHTLRCAFIEECRQVCTTDGSDLHAEKLSQHNGRSCESSLRSCTEWKIQPQQRRPPAEAR